MNRKLVFLFLSTFFLLNPAHADTDNSISESDLQMAEQQTESDSSLFDELNPFDPNIEENLKELDYQYYLDTGKVPFMPGGQFLLFENGQTMQNASKCSRIKCNIWVRVDRSEQKAFIYVNGVSAYEWPVSTGVNGFLTPNFDTHPNGRIYDAYSSKKYPGGDYKGLGNMPYAIFISGGFAIHGTSVSNFPKLGKPASHGCIRLHSENAFILNRLVRKYGILNTWFTVEE
jgi:lipoprotein-anchoring transpeptidase ErfK/SrfK